MAKLSPGYRITPARDIRLELVARSKHVETSFTKNAGEVERIWRETQRSTPGLFNGMLVSLSGVTRKGDYILMRGSLIEYKYYLAHLNCPSLELPIRPVGVSGMVVLSSGGTKSLVLARRSNTVTLWPGSLELLPSGSIDDTYVDRFGRVDYRAQLMDELTEETGVSSDCVTKVIEEAIVVDTHLGVYDICCRMTVRATKESVAKGVSASGEYQEAVFVAEHEIDAFLAENLHMTVPTSVALMKAYTTHE